jgi:hypothetical protein
VGTIEKATGGRGEGGCGVPTRSAFTQRGKEQSAELGRPNVKARERKEGGWLPGSAHVQVEEEGGEVRSGARARARPGGVRRRQGHGRGGRSEAGSRVARVGHTWRMWAI